MLDQLFSKTKDKTTSLLTVCHGSNITINCDSNVVVVAKRGKARRSLFEATIFGEERPIISTLLLIVLPINLQILASLEGADCEYYRTQVATIRECFVVVVRRWQSVQIYER